LPTDLEAVQEDEDEHDDDADVDVDVSIDAAAAAAPSGSFLNFSFDVEAAVERVVVVDEAIEMVEITPDNESGFYPSDTDGATRFNSRENIAASVLSLSISQTDSALGEARFNADASATSSSASLNVLPSSLTQTASTETVIHRIHRRGRRRSLSDEARESGKRLRLELARIWRISGDDDECL